MAAAYEDPPSLNLGSDMFTDPIMFLVTYRGDLSGLKMGVPEITQLLCENPSGPLVAINSNFGAACQAGYEHYIKKKKIKKKRNTPRKPRKVQGNGTCFGTSIEPCYKISTGKIFKLKCFPTGTETQVPDAREYDFSDGHEALVTHVEYLNSLGICGGNIKIENSGPSMLNYRFVLKERQLNTKLILDLDAIFEHLETNNKVKNLGIPINLQHLTFKYKCHTGTTPCIRIFRKSSKVNILGAKFHENCFEICKFLEEIITNNREKFIKYTPLTDREIAQQEAVERRRLTREAKQREAARLAEGETDNETATDFETSTAMSESTWGDTSEMSDYTDADYNDISDLLDYLNISY